MRKELLFATVIFLITILTLLAAIHRFLESWELNEFTFFVAGAVVLFVVAGWGYVLFSVIFAPKKKMEDHLSALSQNILHELNIPLATIQANVTLLRKQHQDEKSLKRLGRIEDASVRLKKLYDELVYGIAKEMHTIETESFDLSVLVNNAVSLFAEQKRNLFHVEVAHTMLEADKIGFEQMFENILSNAMKYSEKEKPIWIRLEDKVLEIQDEGIGMSPTELLQVYERYYQADEKQEGQGIGFALIKSYCDSSGIEIQIVSEKGKGTKISLDLSKLVT